MIGLQLGTGTMGGNVKAIIFDLDGTLIDSAPDIHLACCKVLKAHGLEPVTQAQVRSFVGHGAGVLIDRLIAATGLAAADQPAILAAFLHHYETAVHLTKAYPGVPAALSHLAAEGWSLGICTNKPIVPTRSVLAHLGLADAFCVVIGGDSLTQRKPHPAPLLATMQQMGASAALFVGDSEVDAQTALAADVRFALFTEGYRSTPLGQLPHDHAFADYAALPGIAARWLQGQPVDP